MKETDLIYQLSKQRAEAQTKVNKLDIAIKAIMEVCDHKWKVVKEWTNGHNGEENTDYICELCGKERSK